MSGSLGPAAPATVSSAAMTEKGLTCPDCGDETRVQWGQMGIGEPLRCADCYDDWFYRNSTPEVRAEAERKRDEILRRLAGPYG